MTHTQKPQWNFQGDPGGNRSCSVWSDPHVAITPREMEATICI